ncbi:MAG: histidine phosphatase family protein [Sulfurimonas sp.]|uniref:SixA phosphatase family protein n=1 Tax=Sulfurimonas sp. TaxID=2022749 RepID=UPI0026040203|nr:histidine phosphatase family protein [Sulfurimonas sp.]MCW8894347.1 histidine phosphatase family protein [Sulfurimonas sp.]MCW8954250.1 histidine phosphatase family protein [Sulfurimonas sp.]MCW9066830.1 histidine phosphatase family protein [Sulfurimonas sp.]
MKKLYIIRHAKSSWKDLEIDDFDRPLNKRGKQNAPFMGEKLKEKEIMPDMIISSPALRAKTTAEIIAKKMNYTKEVFFNQDLYEADATTLHNILSKIDNENSVVFLIGHNPELNMLAEIYVGFDENIPTCGVLEVEFNCDRWIDIGANNARLVSFDYPKRYNEVKTDI